MTNEVVYSSRVTIERVKGPVRRAHLPVQSEPVMFGVHSEIAQHYGIDTEVHDSHANPLLSPEIPSLFFIISNISHVLS